MWTLPAILSVGAISYALCDVRSGNLLTRAICPMIFTFSLVALAVWIYVKASASDWRRDDGGGGDGGGGDSGEDGGD
jgi:hypothetical protein